MAGTENNEAVGSPWLMSPCCLYLCPSAYLPAMQEPEKLSSVLVADETEGTYFVPETMSVWNVLEEVRRVVVVLFCPVPQV